MNTSEFNIQALSKALTTLQESWTAYKNNQNEKPISDIIADSCVKRFEYTMETALKLMRRYLKLEYAKDDKELTVNNIFRFMAGYEMIKNWENWKEYYAKRNDTSHEYNIEKARNLLPIIPQFIQDIDYLLNSFTQAINKSENND